MMWKALKFPFHLVGNWLVWQVGKGDWVQIGLDSRVGGKGRHILVLQLILELKSKGYYLLRHVANR
jgi:hypothetical protein